MNCRPRRIKIRRSCRDAVSKIHKNGRFVNRPYLKLQNFAVSGFINSQRSIAFAMLLFIMLLLHFLR